MDDKNLPEKLINTDFQTQLQRILSLSFWEVSVGGWVTEGGTQMVGSIPHIKAEPHVVLSPLLLCVKTCLLQVCQEWGGRHSVGIVSVVSR